jgi:hypothetical protein
MRFGIPGVLERKRIWPSRFFTAWLQLTFGEIKSHLLSIHPAPYASLTNLKLCCTGFGSAHLLKVARHTLVRWCASLLMKSTPGMTWTGSMHFFLSRPCFVPSKPWGFGSFCGDSLCGLSRNQVAFNQESWHPHHVDQLVWKGLREYARSAWSKCITVITQDPESSTKVLAKFGVTT